MGGRTTYPQPSNRPINGLGGLQLLPGQAETLEVLAGCVEYSWPVVLTVASRSGKSALVSLLAQLCGRQLTVLSFTLSMDTMELLGGFEQSDASRSLGGLKERLLAWARDSAVALLVGQCTRGLLLLQSVLQVEQLLREAW